MLSLTPSRIDYPTLISLEYLSTKQKKELLYLSYNKWRDSSPGYPDMKKHYNAQVPLKRGDLQRN